ncbi:MAG: hypothetical protein R2854_04695 [Caldilineaceae bacterium]
MTTPMRRQYLDIKRQVPDCILLFRLGDFYEILDDDAKIVAPAMWCLPAGRCNDQRAPRPACPITASKATSPSWWSRATKSPSPTRSASRARGWSSAR